MKVKQRLIKAITLIRVKHCSFCITDANPLMMKLQSISADMLLNENFSLKNKN